MIPIRAIDELDAPMRVESCAVEYRLLLLIALAATAVVAPMFFLGDASGHDFQFHVASWTDVAGQWHQGIVYPRWAEWANWGYGEPRFIFYPPASWILGAGLGVLLPWRAAPAVYIWLTLLASGLAFWALAREYLSSNEAQAAGVFFAVNPYNLALVYYRSDFAEMLAVAMLPLLVLGVLRVLRDGWRRVPLLAFALAGVWLSNAPAAVVATYSVAVLLVTASVTERTVRPLFAGGTAIAAGFALAAFYILPAAFEQQWVQIKEAVSPSLRPQQNFLFTHRADPEFLLFNWKISGLALGTILLAAILAVFVARRRAEFPRVWRTLIALGSASVFMMFPLSRTLWRFLPKLEFVQFPWRWLSSLAVVYAFFAGAALRGHRRRWILWMSIGVLVGGMATAMAFDTWWDTDDAITIADWVHAGLGYEGTDEYAPIGTDRYELPGINSDSEQPPDRALPPAAEYDPASESIVPSPDFHVTVKRWTAEHRVLLTFTAKPIDVSLRLLSYPAWSAQIDHRAVPLSTVPGTGEILLPLPAGEHEIELEFQRTWDRTAGGLISIATALLLCGSLFLARRRTVSR
ncbi:MAG TPA: 6-pyruvoyl-tetrahydropterin synthase-related protein [Candidatus Cybelea sp.]|nr:6-pyruvoyl-tetrahydropterin synthase-related protein [Candidatus Cybelea sp.]